MKRKRQKKSAPAMEKNLPCRKNDRAVLMIEDIGSSGEGIGFLQDHTSGAAAAHTSSPKKGFAVFVKDAVPGDRIEATITKVTSRYAYGHLDRILEPSPHRVQPRCRIARTCGGCQLQALDYERQLAFKQKKVRENLIRIGGFAPETVNAVLHPIVGMEDPWHYRNKEQVPVRAGKYGPVTGFYASHSHTVIPMTDCCIGSPRNRQILETILSWMQAHGVPAYDEETGKGLIRHILLRDGICSGQVMVCIVANDYRLPFEKELVEALCGLNEEADRDVLRGLNEEADRDVLRGLNEEADRDVLYGLNEEADRDVLRDLNEEADRDVLYGQREWTQEEPVCGFNQKMEEEAPGTNGGTWRISSIVLNTNTDRNNVITGRLLRTLWGRDAIEDTLYIHEVVRKAEPEKADPGEPEPQKAESEKTAFIKAGAQRAKSERTESGEPGPQKAEYKEAGSGNTKFRKTEEAVTFGISPLSFYQVNPRQTEKLYSLALDCAGLTGQETVWDLYCGVGTISLFMARHARQVYGVEIIPEAIENARDNARRNGIDNACFYVGKAEEILPAYVKNLRAQDLDPQIDVICVDPPRKGCDDVCIRTMLEIAPRRIVYVSCDPATLARDLKKLAEGGYKLDYVQPVDQFAHTVHVETVVLMSRKDT